MIPGPGPCSQTATRSRFGVDAGPPQSPNNSPAAAVAWNPGCPTHRLRPRQVLPSVRLSCRRLGRRRRRLRLGRWSRRLHRPRTSRCRAHSARAPRWWRHSDSSRTEVRVVGFHFERIIHLVHHFARSITLQLPPNLFLGLIEREFALAVQLVNVVSAPFFDHLGNLARLQVKHRGMSGLQAGTAYAGQIHRRRFDFHAGGVERLLLQLHEVLSSRGSLAQALGQLGHLPFGGIGVRFFLGFFGLLRFFAQSLVLLLIFLGLGRRLLGARHEHTVQVGLFEAIGMFLVILFDFFLGNVRRFLLNVLLQHLAQNLHLRDLEFLFKLWSLVQVLFLGLIRHPDPLRQQTRQLLLLLRRWVLD